MRAEIWFSVLALFSTVLVFSLIAFSNWLKRSSTLTIYALLEDEPFTLLYILD